MSRESFIWIAATAVVALMLGSPLLAQQKALPAVAYAVAPEWPTAGRVEEGKPHTQKVIVSVKVDGFGNVVSARLTGPKSPYSKDALHAAWRWKFGPPEGYGPDPAKLNGMTATLKFVFRLLPADAPASELGAAFVPPYEFQLSRRAKR
jgi:hypothetical protein